MLPIILYTNRCNKFYCINQLYWCLWVIRRGFWLFYCFQLELLVCINLICVPFSGMYFIFYYDCTIIHVHGGYENFSEGFAFWTTETRDRSDILLQSTRVRGEYINPGIDGPGQVRNVYLHTRYGYSPANDKINNINIDDHRNNNLKIKSTKKTRIHVGVSRSTVQRLTQYVFFHEASNKFVFL